MSSCFTMRTILITQLPFVPSRWKANCFNPDICEIIFADTHIVVMRWFFLNILDTICILCIILLVSRFCCSTLLLLRCSWFDSLFLLFAAPCSSCSTALVFSALAKHEWKADSCKSAAALVAMKNGRSVLVLPSSLNSQSSKSDAFHIFRLVWTAVVISFSIAMSNISTAIHFQSQM